MNHFAQFFAFTLAAVTALGACGPKDETKTTVGTVQTTAMASIRATTMESDLKGLGLDPAKLPKFAELTKEQKKGLMPLFVKSLGASCGTCHAGRGETPNMRLTKKMWDEWMVGFTVQSASGAGVTFCDSCHQGKKEFLDRADHDGLSKWMKENFVDRHVASSGAKASCARCHGEPFKGEFLAGWAN